MSPVALDVPIASPAVLRQRHAALAEALARRCRPCALVLGAPPRLANRRQLANSILELGALLEQHAGGYCPCV